MPVDLSDILVVGVSSRALFDLEDENAIFDTEGIEGYRKYQLAHENEPLKIGSAFYLVKSLLELNNQANKRIVEIVLMSRNSPETGIRMPPPEGQSKVFWGNNFPMLCHDMI